MSGGFGEERRNGGKGTGNAGHERAAQCSRPPEAETIDNGQAEWPIFRRSLPAPPARTRPPRTVSRCQNRMIVRRSPAQHLSRGTAHRCQPPPPARHPPLPPSLPACRARGPARRAPPAAEHVTARMLGDARMQRYRVGVIVMAVGGPCRGLYATLPVPAAWPEQQVRIVEEEVSPGRAGAAVSHPRRRGRADGGLDPLAGRRRQEQAIVTFELERSAILPPGRHRRLADSREARPARCGAFSARAPTSRPATRRS